MKNARNLGSVIFILSVFLFQMESAASFAEAKTYKTKNVFIAVIDGPRWTETWGEKNRKYIPLQNKELSAEGALFTHFLNEGVTNTTSGHTALVTGFYQEIDNSGHELPRNSSILQRWLKKTLEPRESAWVIASKDKLAVLADTTDPDWHEMSNPRHNCGINGGGVGSGYRDDSETWKVIQTTLKEYHPRLVVINFKEPDSSGHNNQWDQYLKGIQDTDQYVYQLWQLIQKDPFYKDQTTLFITNDHGRHLDGVKDGFVSHGDSCDGCRHISLLALGPDFKRGVVIDEKGTQIDVAVTAALLLGVEIPGSQGRVLKEIFIEEPALIAVQ